MTANWFECKVKYLKVGDDGKEKKVSELYLLDALSYTEAEGRITAELSAMIQGDYEIAGLKRSSISEWVVSNDGNDDKWFKAKISIIDADHLTGKEKRSHQYFLVAGATLERALANLQESLSTYIVPYEIASLADTAFVDVLPYEVKDEQAPAAEPGQATPGGE
ncbi:MAG: DUF4494 domain-containing protein [Odoribacteraceae bacterium]|jgi:hypothetical protein|nr:DUF4494 domain-containing protein [Odoribacteraceae bacterium]